MAIQRIRQEIVAFHDQFYDSIEKTDFSIPTFLALGAVLQLLCLACLPFRVSASLPVLWLVYRLVVAAIGSRDVFRTSFTDINRGKHMSRVPQSSDGVVAFIIGARLNHPFGKLAPGMVEIDIVFKDMWRDCEKNRVKYGYLGRTATLADTSDKEGTTTAWITYWKDVNGLHDFAFGAAHRLGWKLHEKGSWPHVGIMHELYHAPAGHHEAIYKDFRPFGLSSTKFFDEKDGHMNYLDPLVPNKKGSTMFSRMAMAEKKA